MTVIAHDSYKIDVCSACGERVLAVGYLCNHIPMHEAESLVIEVVPASRLRGAVSLLDDLSDVLADVQAGVVPADGSIVRDVLKRAVNHVNGGQ